MKQRLTARRLVAELGKDLAFQVMHRWGGCQVPKLSDQFRERVERDERIRRELDEGETYRDCADRYGLDPARIVQIAGR